MIYINHRINTIQQLQSVPKENGVELDIRYHQNDLVLHHDPFHHHENSCERFEDFLKEWQHEGPIILNIKTEGVEKACIALINKYNVKNWFFLDLSMPYFVLYAEKAKNNELEGFSLDNLAVRFSEFEPIEYALSFVGRVKWVWVDCFTHNPLNDGNYAQLKKAGFKICLVSPELQNHSLKHIPEFKEIMKDFEIDAVCTKRPNLWKETSS